MVPNGFEVVSPVLSGDAGLEQAKIALDALHQAGGRVDRRCGLHLHAGAGDLSPADIATVVRRYAKFEEQIDGWMAPSRRGDANHFCHSVRSFLQSGGSANDRLQSGTVAEVCRAFGTRYMKVNLEAFGNVTAPSSSGITAAPSRRRRRFPGFCSASGLLNKAARSPKAPTLRR